MSEPVKVRIQEIGDPWPATGELDQRSVRNGAGELACATLVYAEQWWQVR